MRADLVERLEALALGHELSAKGYADSAYIGQDHRANALALREAALALRALRDAPVGWRPIESAPRDGTWVLLYSADEGVECAYWGGTYFGYDPDWITHAHRADCTRARGTPTHWQRLPEPPVVVGEEG